MKTRCECERGMVEFFISIRKADGELLDEVGMCSECLRETAARRALEALGLQP